MKKSINEVLASNLPMIVATSASISSVRVRKYKDSETGTAITCNYLASPISPISGKRLIPDGTKIVTLSKAEIDSLESLGVCPECGSELKVQASLAEKMCEADHFHCIVCGEELKCTDMDVAEQEGDEHEQEESSMTSVTSEGETVENMEEKFSNFYDKLGDNYDETIEDSEENLKEEASDEHQEGVEEDIKSDLEKQNAPVNFDEVRVDMLSKCESNLADKVLEIVSSTKDTYHYLMVARKPVATLHRARAIASVQDMFDNKPQLLSALTSAIKDGGFTKEVCSNFGIVPIVLKVQANDCIQKAIDEKEQELTEAFEEKCSQMEEDYDQCLGMAAVAVNRNLIKGQSNLLAEKLVSKFEALGIEDSRQIVESVFAEHGEDYLRSIVVQAKAYSKESSDARNVLAKTILESSFHKKELGHNVVSNVVEAEKPEDQNFNVDLFRENLRKII